MLWPHQAEGPSFLSAVKLVICFQANVITKNKDGEIKEEQYDDVSFVPMLAGKSEDGNDVWMKKLNIL